MSSFVKKVNRRIIHFSDHALDRWWERFRKNETGGRKEALELLRRSLEESREQKNTPPWYSPSLFHKATTHHFVSLDNGERGFVVMKNPSGDFVAVTYIDKEMSS
jgi:hypothetical protein